MQYHSHRGIQGGGEGLKLTAVFHPQSMGVSVKPPSMATGFGNPIARDYVERPAYEGDYTITPSAEEQILVTRNLRMTDNITINPIPSNYGLITWNGSTLTVS